MRVVRSPAGNLPSRLSRKVIGCRAAECAGRSTLALCWCLISAGVSPRPSPPSPSVRDQIDIELASEEQELRGLCAGQIHRDDLHAPSRGRLYPRAADGAAAAREGMVLHYSASRARCRHGTAGGRSVTVGRSPFVQRNGSLVLIRSSRRPIRVDTTAHVRTAVAASTATHVAHHRWSGAVPAGPGGGGFSYVTASAFLVSCLLVWGF